MMANVGFNGTHQKIVFDVTDRFYQLGTARQKVMATQSALDAAKTVEQAAQARFDNGLATKPELLQAQQQSAQSNFDLQASLGAESDARVALIESIGLLPTVTLKVADLPEKSHLNAQSEDSVGELTMKTEFSRVAPSGSNNPSQNRRVWSRSRGLAALVALIGILIFVVRPLSHR